jgi:hypothetical protein
MNLKNTAGNINLYPLTTNLFVMYVDLLASMHLLHSRNIIGGLLFLTKNMLLRSLPAVAVLKVNRNNFSLQQNERDLAARRAPRAKSGCRM